MNLNEAKIAVQQAGWRQARLARRMGVSEAMISQLLGGKKFVRARLDQIHDLAGIPMATLLAAFKGRKVAACDLSHNR